MSNEHQNSNLPARRDEPRKLVLTPTNEISLEGLSPEATQQLLADHARGMSEVAILAAKYGVETKVLATALRNMSDETVNATKENTHITVTRFQEDSLGKTEVIMGNTEAAKKGKLTRSQAGLPDYTFAYIIAAVVIVIVLALLLKR